MSNFGNMEGGFQKFGKKRGFGDFEFGKNKKRKKWKRNTERKEKCFAELDKEPKFGNDNL